MHRLLFVVTFTMVSAALAQDPAAYVPRGKADPLALSAPPDVYQVRYASNLNKGDSVINITNTGSEDFSTFADNLCVNIFTFDASEEMLSCCACLVTPNGLVSISAQTDLITNPLSPAAPTSVVIKLVATNALSNGISFCDPGNIDPDGDIISPGIRAWGTTLHALPNGTYGLTEGEFLNGGISGAELTHLTTFCKFIQSNGSGFGLCKSCRAGGLAGAKQ